MTNYGTIQTPSHASPSSPVVDVESLSSDAVAIRRPWKVMFDFHSMELPCSVSDASSRFKTNYNYFLPNYWILFFIITSIVIFTSLIKHPLSLMAFTVMVILFIFLVYLQNKDEPVVLFRYRISDWMIGIVQSCLMLLTVALLILTNATCSFGRPLVIGYVLMLIHTVVRKTKDLYIDEEAATTMTESYWNPLGLHVTLALFYLYFNFG